MESWAVFVLMEDLGSIPGLGRSPGKGKGNPLQYSDGVTPGHYSFSFEALGKSNIEGKALTEDSLNGSDEWKRVCVKPSDFLKADSSYGNFGWDVVKKKVTTISVFAYDETELWIDDITLYGVKPSDFAVK